MTNVRIGDDGVARTYTPGVVSTMPDEPTRDQILGRLNAHLTNQRRLARPLMVVESGSRQWGFHNPSSDYDIRAVVASPPRLYLTVGTDPPPKVMDWTEDIYGATLDFVAWDVFKWATLLLKGNVSAYRYAEQAAANMGYFLHPALSDFVFGDLKQYWRRDVAARHHYHQAGNFYHMYLGPIVGRPNGPNPKESTKRWLYFIYNFAMTMQIAAMVEPPSTDIKAATINVIRGVFRSEFLTLVEAHQHSQDTEHAEVPPIPNLRAKAAEMLKAAYEHAYGIDKTPQPDSRAINSLLKDLFFGVIR